MTAGKPHPTHAWRTGTVKGKPTTPYCERCGIDQGEPGTDRPCRPTRIFG